MRYAGTRQSSSSGERGLALFSTMILIMIMITLGSASLVYSTVDLKATSHFRTGNAAFTAAESGILHALSTINQRMVLNFGNDIVDNWSADSSGTLLGSAELSVPGSPTLLYQATVGRHDTSPGNLGWVFGQGKASMDAVRRVKVLVRRSMIPGSPGAIYAYNDDPIDPSWVGNTQFSVNGNSVDTGGNGDGQRLVPGVATRNQGNADALTSELASGQRDQVQGLGYDDSTDPPTPSIMNTGGPSESDVDQIVNDILANNPTCPPGVALPTCVYQINDSTVNAADLPVGTASQPAIIHLTNTSQTTLRINGNWTGVGILIADGPLKVNGTMEFYGWIISRATTTTHQENVISGNAQIRGSVWTAADETKIGGSATVEFCVDCLQLASESGLNLNGDNMPRPMEIVAWYEDQ